MKKNQYDKKSIQNIMRQMFNLFLSKVPTRYSTSKTQFSPNGIAPNFEGIFLRRNSYSLQIFRRKEPLEGSYPGCIIARPLFAFLGPPFSHTSQNHLPLN